MAKTKKQKAMRNLLNSAIVNQMQHTREHAVVTKDRDNTMIHDKIAIKAKELDTKFHRSNISGKVGFKTIVIKKFPQGRLKRSVYFLIEHKIMLLMVPNMAW